MHSRATHEYRNVKEVCTDAVWGQDDDMVIGILEAIKQAKRTDIKFVVGGGGMKEMVQRVGDGDAMVPVDVLYSPTMVAR